MQRKHLLALGLTAALVSVGAFAQKAGLFDSDDPRAPSADLPATAQQKLMSMRAGDAARAKAAPPMASAAAVTVDDVGDVDSFGRNVKWLGIMSAFVTLEDVCPAPDPAVPNQFCQTLNPTPGATTGFTFNDMARVTLPGKSTNSILCYWFSPVISVTYQNLTGTRATAQLRYSPTLTIENPLLADPALIDPTTGAPFGGQLLTSMTSSEIFQVPLEPGVSFTERTRDSAVCMAGFLSKRALVDTYGLTEAQAIEFFKQPTTIRLNVTGNARHVAFTGLTFGLRVMGD